MIIDYLITVDPKDDNVYVHEWLVFGYVRYAREPIGPFDTVEEAEAYIKSLPKREVKDELHD